MTALYHKYSVGRKEVFNRQKHTGETKNIKNGFSCERVKGAIRIIFRWFLPTPDGRIDVKVLCDWNPNQHDECHLFYLHVLFTPKDVPCVDSLRSLLGEWTFWVISNYKHDDEVPPLLNSSCNFVLQWKNFGLALLFCILQILSFSWWVTIFILLPAKSWKSWHRMCFACRYSLSYIPFVRFVV